MHVIPAHRAPHRRRDVAQRAASLRAAARDVLRGAVRISRRSAAWRTAAGRRSSRRARRSKRACSSPSASPDYVIDGRSDARRRDCRTTGGRAGSRTGDSANDLWSISVDPNVHIQETKAATCDIRPGRRPRGTALPRSSTITGGAPACRWRSDGAVRRDRRRPRGGDLRRDAQPRKGFFTDTTLCIGCKACEVACKEWNQLPADGMTFTAQSYDNTGELNGDDLAARRVRRAVAAAAPDARRRRCARRPGAG